MTHINLCAKLSELEKGTLEVILGRKAIGSNRIASCSMR